MTKKKATEDQEKAFNTLKGFSIKKIETDHQAEELLTSFPELDNIV